MPGCVSVAYGGKEITDINMKATQYSDTDIKK